MWPSDEATASLQRQADQAAALSSGASEPNSCDRFKGAADERCTLASVESGRGATCSWPYQTLGSTRCKAGASMLHSFSSGARQARSCACGPAFATSGAIGGAGRTCGAARPFVQQLQCLQVQGLQRQPALCGAGAAVGLLVFVMCVLLCLPEGDSGSTLRTVVRSQAA